MIRFVIALLALMLVAEPAWAEIGRIKRAVGVASVQRGKQKLPATPGLVVEEGDVLVTGKDGRISLTFTDNTRFSAGPSSRIAVSEYKFDRTAQIGSFVTSVDRGSLAVVSGQIAKSGKDAMKVRTPTSLLGVRGTRFVVNAG